MMPSLALLLLALVPPAAQSELPAVEEEAFAPFTFVQIGDPQIGYGQGALSDARRFGRLAPLVDAEEAAFAVVVGDLTQDRTPTERWLLRRGLEDFETPLRLVPGNHDVLDLETLEAYRRDHGPDYGSFVYRGCTFLLLDSETLFDDSISRREHERQWAWLETELEASAAAGRQHAFAVLHRPPRGGLGERLLERLQAHGVRTVLAGHLHQTREIVYEGRGITCFTVGGTARVSDGRGFGYRVFQVARDGVEQRYVPFEYPSWFARYGWSPRLLDPSLGHWALTVLFAWAALAARRAAQRERERHAAEPEGEPGGRLWTGLAAIWFVLALSTQLDLDELVNASVRRVAHAGGWYGARAGLQSTLFAALLLAGLPLAVLLARAAWRTGRGTTLALASVAFPVFSFLVHTVSLHALEAALYAAGRLGLFLAEGGCALVSVLAARRSIRT